MNKEQLKEKHRSYLQKLELSYSILNLGLHFRLWILELMISWIKD